MSKRTKKQCVELAKSAYASYTKAGEEIVALVESCNAYKITIAALFGEYASLSTGHRSTVKTQFAKETGIPRSTVIGCLNTADVINATGDEDVNPKTVRRCVSASPDRDPRVIRAVHTADSTRDKTSAKLANMLEHVGAVESDLKFFDFRLSDKAELVLLSTISSKIIAAVDTGLALAKKKATVADKAKAASNKKK